MTNGPGTAKAQYELLLHPVHQAGMVVRSEALRRLMNLVERVACSQAAVLITGETGCGKELIARGIHYHSNRREKPWIDINCAALPEHLIESELFGYEKGAFSGADQAKPGMFELANHGTLFLDEIGELDPKLQVKLLRVLDGQPYYRLGGKQKIIVDVRIVAATNQDLVDAQKHGRFRSDLYHRLSQFQLRLPPLRERPDDIVGTAEYFLRSKFPDVQLSSEALESLLAYDWPGNVRELQNAIVQAATMCASGVITAADLPLNIPAPTPIAPQPPRFTLNQSLHLDELERLAIQSALEYSAGNQGTAAHMLGISRRTLSRKLRLYRGEGESVPLGTIAKEQQLAFRARATVPVVVKSESGQATVASADISRGGVGVCGLDPAIVGNSDLMDLTVVLPSGRDVKARGKVVWSGTQGRCGIQFVQIDEADQHELAEWVDGKIVEEGWVTEKHESAGPDRMSPQRSSESCDDALARVS